jgi:hypothetical protein
MSKQQSQQQQQLPYCLTYLAYGYLEDLLLQFYHGISTQDLMKHLLTISLIGFQSSSTFVFQSPSKVILDCCHNKVILHAIDHGARSSIT